MSEFFQNGGNPPVVGRKPTSSDKAAPLCFAHRQWDEEELAQKIRTMLHVDLDEVESLDFGDRCTFEAAGVEYADGKGLVLWSCKHYFLYINGEEVVVEQDTLGNVLANYEYGGSKAVNAYLDSIGESGEVSNDIRCDTPALVVEPVPTSADITPDLEESSDVSTSLKMQIQSEGGSVVTEVVDSQVLPEAPDWQVFNFVTMLNLLSDVIDTSDISDLIDGRDDGVIQYIRCGIQSEKIQVESREELSVLFLGQKLKPMTFNAFGNFLYALKHHGEEVALSVLHRIYSGEDEE